MTHTRTGNFRFHQAFRSRFLKSARDIIVYLPPEYEISAVARYPVLYMHDGQNLFDAATAFGGNEWGMDETSEALIRERQIEPLIIVGVYNTGVERVAEYTFVKDKRGRGGRARAYAKLLVQELKPFIDAEYRTLGDAGNTAVGGSSLGGLVSLYLGLHHPEVFGKLLVMSPSVWWAQAAILKDLARMHPERLQKIWLDIGTEEDINPEAHVEMVRSLRDVLLHKGWKEGRDLVYFEDQGGRHHESAWGRRLPGALKFLFPA